MISDRDLVALTRDRSPCTGQPISREQGEAWLAEYNRDGSWSLVDVPTCRCCGEPAWPNLRCTKHQGRNPCAVEGCERTTKANGKLRDDWTLCGEHWRAFVPPGSPTRRAFNRLARVAKRLGYKRKDRWPDELETRWWLLWRGVMRRVRRAADGHIDQAEIERLFGWINEEG